MALTRTTSFAAGKLPFEDLNSEMNNIVNYINTRVLANPLTSNLDFADQWTIDNLRTFWNIRNVAEYASLASAEASLPATGGFLLIPPNTTISLSAAVTLSKDNTWIVGSGPSSIIQRASGTFTPVADTAILMNGRLNCGIMNLQFDGQQLSNSLNTGFSPCHVKGASKGIYFGKLYVRRWGGSTDPLNERNDGFLIGENESTVPDGVFIFDSIFEDVRRNDVAVINGRNIFIDRNQMKHSSISSNAAVDIEENAIAGMRLQNLFVTRNQIGDVTLGSARHLYGIVVQATTSLGADASTSFSGAIVSDNHIVNCGDFGIMFNRWLDGSVLNNRIYRCGQTAASAGIRVTNSQMLTISKNRIYEQGEGLAVATGSDADGINVGLGDTVGQPNSKFISIEGNVIWKTARRGIGVSPTNAVAPSNIEINGNTILEYSRRDSNSGDGIVVDANATAVTDIDIRNNRVSMNGITPSGFTNPNGVRFTLGGGTITGVILMGNNLRGSALGSGSVVSGRTNVTNLEEGHNLEV